MSTTLLTLLLVGASVIPSGSKLGLPALGQPSDPPLRVTAASAGAGAGGQEAMMGTEADRDTSSPPPRLTTVGAFTRQPIVRGAVIGTILGAVVGLLGGATVGAIMGGVIRSLP
jgi:hypothetical protein